MKTIKHLLVILGLVLLVTLIPSKSVEAANIYPNVTSITQTGATSTSFKVTVEGKDADNYNFYLYDDVTSQYVLKGSMKEPGDFTFSGLQQGRKYNIKVEASNVATTWKSTRSFYNAVTLVSSVTGLYQKKWWKYIKSLDVEWDKLNACDYFEYQVQTSSGKNVKKDKTTNNGFSVKIKNEYIYTIKVRAVQTYNGTKIITPWAKINCFIQPTVKASSFGKKGLTIKWSATKGATGYVIYATDKKKAKATSYKKIASVKKNKTSYTISKINKKKVKASKTYYIYVVTKYGKSQSEPVYYYTVKGSSVIEGWIN